MALLNCSGKTRKPWINFLLRIGAEPRSPLAPRKWYERPNKAYLS